MSLLKLVLSSSARRGCQNALPALWSALAADSTLQAVQHQAVVAAAAANTASQQLPSFRSFHVGSSLLSADQVLGSVLAKEVKHEKTTYEQDEMVAAGPPAPFQLSSSPGDSSVSLSRDYKGEKISVDCSIVLQDSLAGSSFGLEGDEEEDEGSMDDTNDINFNVTVTKGDKALVFECISDGSYVDIRHVSFEPAAGIESESAFTGPVFPELDNELQGAFRDYLKERGVNEDLGEYLRHLLYDKEQQEYVRWLEGVRTFVS